MKDRNLLLGVALVIVIIAVGAVVVGLGITSQPQLPPTQTPPPVVPTGGDVNAGVITNICGGPSNPNGIGSADGVGCSDACTNNGGSTSSCTPDANEYGYVVVCDGKTGIQCGGDVPGRTVADNLKGSAIRISDYLSQGCTIQIDIFADGTRPGGNPPGQPTDFIVFQKNDCGTTTPPVEPPTPNQCGETCSVNADCETGLRCNAGTCELRACVNDPTRCEADHCSLLPVPGQCGDTCTTNSECPTGNVCSNNVCMLAACSTDPSQCATDLCTLEDAPQCGDECTTSTDCPTDHVCGAGGSCVLEVCEDGSADCSSDQCTVIPPTDNPPQCGDDCGSDSDCPNDHTCSNGSCVADICLNGGCSDGCTLPATDLSRDEMLRLMAGLLVLIIGVIVWRTNLHVELFYMAGGRRLTANFSETEKSQLDRDLARVEEQRKLARNRKLKRERKGFEESLLKDES